MGGKGLLVTYNSNKAYLLGEKGYEEYFFDEPSTIVHLA